MAHSNSSPRARRHSRASIVTVCLIACPLARANINVEVRGVDEQLRANVLAYLSVERYKRTAPSADTMERLHDRVEREVQSALKPFGYYEPQVRSEVSDVGHGDWRVTIDIDPGTPVLIDKIDVQVHGPGEGDRLFRRIIANLPLRPADRLSHAAYEAIKKDLQRTVATYGYLDARLTRNELVVDPPNHKASVALAMDTGERYHFGATSIEQTAVADTLVHRYLRYSEGDPFDLTQILRTQFALDDAQYFSNLEVLPGEPDRAAHVVPVSIRAEPSRRNHYSFAAGYATDTGPRGTLGWEERRINSHGHRFNMLVQAAQVTRYSLQSRYVVPIGDPAVENLTLASTVEQRQLADVTTRTLSLGPSVTKVDSNWQHVWTVTGMRTTGETAVETLTHRLLVPSVALASVPKGYLGEPIFQHPFFAELRGSHSVFGSDSNFIQLHVQAERVFHLATGWHLLLRDEVGATLVSRFSQLPEVMRFFAGGDNSVRGFAYNDLSPTETICQDPNKKYILYGDGSQCAQPAQAQTIKVGGKDLITGTVELIRDLPNNFGIATFFDYGNAFDHFGGRTGNQLEILGVPLEYSVGIGFRVRLPVVTLGVDVAQPLSRNTSPRLHINFSPKL